MSKRWFLNFLFLSILLFVSSCEINSNKTQKKEKEGEEIISIPVFLEQPVTRCITKGETGVFSCNADAEGKQIYYKWFETNYDSSEKHLLVIGHHRHLLKQNQLMKKEFIIIFVRQVL